MVYKASGFCLRSIGKTPFIYRCLHEHVIASYQDDAAQSSSDIKTAPAFQVSCCPSLHSTTLMCHSRTAGHHCRFRQGTSCFEPLTSRCRRWIRENRIRILGLATHRVGRAISIPSNVDVQAGDLHLWPSYYQLVGCVRSSLFAVCKKIDHPTG